MNVDVGLVRAVLDTLRPGKPLTDKAIAELVEKPLKDVRAALTVLNRNGSAHTLGDGSWRVAPVLERPADDSTRVASWN